MVLRESGGPDYNPWIYKLAAQNGVSLNSVTTLLFLSRDASYDPAVLKIISNAEAIFFAGGDQGQYIRFWMNTDVQTLIQTKVANVTIGGTSAGLAILGELFMYIQRESNSINFLLSTNYHNYRILSSNRGVYLQR